MITQVHKLAAARIIQAKGFSLLELIVFIITISLLAVALFSAYSQALRGAAVPEQNAVAARLAHERLELILAQRRALGFAGFTNATFDPCTSAPVSTLSVCTVLPAGYTFSPPPQLTLGWGGDLTNYKVITVNVAGKGSAVLQALVANY